MADADGIDPKVWRVAAVVLLGPFMTLIDSTVVNVSLATIRLDLHASIDSAQWIISGYLLALALMLPINGWLVDRVGAKRLYMACFSGFTAASALCGAAHTMNQLIGFRVVQGMAGGLLAPMTQLMLARVAGRHMARVMGYATLPILIAPIMGPVLAGAILKYASWPWLFFFNLPVGTFALCLAVVLLPRDEGAIERRPFDLGGFFLISPGLACTLYGFEHVTDRIGAGTLAIGLVLLAGFTWRAIGMGSAALIDLRLFRNRTFTASATTQFLSNGAMFAGQFLIPLFLITACKLTPSYAGWVLAAMGLGMLCSLPSMGFLTDKFGCRAVSATGACLALVGVLPFLWMVDHGFSLPLTLATLFILGAGRGGIGIPSISAAYSSVPKDKLPIATTAINIVQRLGGPLATTTIAMIMTQTRAVPSSADPHAFLIAFIVLTIIHVLVVGAAFRLPIRVAPRAAATT